MRMLSFVSEARALAEAVGLVARAAATKDTLPALTGVLLRGAEGEIELVGTDTEVGVSVRIPADVASPGSVLFPARRLQELLRTVPPIETVEVRAIEGTATVRFGRSRFDLVTLPLAEYPSIAFAEPDAGTVRADLMALRAGLGLVSYAVATQEGALPVLLGLHLAVVDGRIELCASDNFRLAWASAPALEVREPFDLVVRGRSLVELLRLGGSDAVVLVPEDRRLSLVMGSVRAFVQRIDGRFPDHRQLLQRAFVTHLDFDVADLLAASERALLVTDPRTPQMVLHLRPGEPVGIESGSADFGQAVQEIPGMVSGDPLDIGFNPRYLVDALRNIGLEKARLSFSGQLSAAKLVPQEGPEDRLALLLPLKIW
jgi:DNA polymerase-3 subunit beta